MSLDLFITNVCINPTFMLSLVINVSSFLYVHVLFNQTRQPYSKAKGIKTDWSAFQTNHKE